MGSQERFINFNGLQNIKKELNLDNIILTPHIAASTDEAQIIVAEMIANQFCDYFKNNNIVNSIT